MEDTIFNGETHYKWLFSIAILIYQRVQVIHYDVLVSLKSGKTAHFWDSRRKFKQDFAPWWWKLVSRTSADETAPGSWKRNGCHEKTGPPRWRPWKVTKVRETGRNQLLSVNFYVSSISTSACLAEGTLGFDPTLETHGWIVWGIACHKLSVFNCFCLLGIYRKLPPQLFVFRRILAANNVTMDILATNPTGSLVSQLAYPAVAVDRTWTDWEIHKMGMFLSIPYSMCFRICVHACMMYV